MIPAFSACTESPEPGMSTSTHRVGDADHLHLALAGADRLEEDELLAGGVEHEQRLQRRLGEAAEVAARPHRADEDAGVEEVVGEPDAVAEERALRERARRVDRDDADRAASARGRGAAAPRSRLDLPTPGGPVSPTAYALPVSG